MGKCLDLLEEQQSTMDVLFSKLSEKGDVGLQLLTSPKYLCELAGERIEYCWGVVEEVSSKFRYEKKRRKDMFENNAGN